MVAIDKGHLNVVEVFLKEPKQQCDLNLQENVHSIDANPYYSGTP